MICIRPKLEAEKLVEGEAATPLHGNFSLNRLCVPVSGEKSLVLSASRRLCRMRPILLLISLAAQYFARAGTVSVHKRHKAGGMGEATVRQTALCLIASTMSEHILTQTQVGARKLL